MAIYLKLAVSKISSSRLESYNNGVIFQSVSNLIDHMLSFLKIFMVFEHKYANFSEEFKNVLKNINNGLWIELFMVPYLIEKITIQDCPFIWGFIWGS
jgi:hypothetical protein